MKEGLALAFDENKLIFFEFKKKVVALIPDIIRKEFKDAQVINEHNSKEKVIYQVYLYENDIEFTIRIIASYFYDSITIIADEVNITIRAYQVLHKKLANDSLS
ncbi:hypothetical protein QD46_24355 [Paenibacillus polymyxa]|uniref:hypothetical protein n=1 Tax=Paenibacillus polymyxa TaxID=1406 RepID=UPI0005CE16F4|nr:hypothetical protein [Paenibacillus polymyxa]KJD37494.1 hypothetical protein QD46_24355 [Paenibacillus polymyxa]MBY7740184.1 hypothetical protein [Paenibacillus polymyxa]